MRRNLLRAVATALAVHVLLLATATLPSHGQDSALQGEWIGSFGCEGALTYIRMSVGADQVALHAFNETVLYKPGKVTGDSFEALQIPPIKAPATTFPAAISAVLSLPDDLLTGTLDGWGGDKRDCTHFVMVRIVKWPKADKPSGQLLVPTSGVEDEGSRAKPPVAWMTEPVSSG